MSLALRIATAAALIVCCAAGCRRDPTSAELQEIFSQAETLYRDAKFEDAQTLLKFYLQYDPMNPGAHFYLAGTYLVADDFRSLIAEGEYQTALRLFNEQGRVSRIERYPADYFELICQIDSAKVWYRRCKFEIGAGVSMTVIRDSFQRASHYLKLAQGVNPDAQEIDEVRAELQLLASKIGTPPPNSGSKGVVS